MSEERATAGNSPTLITLAYKGNLAELEGQRVIVHALKQSFPDGTGALLTERFAIFLYHLAYIFYGVSSV